jgi:ribosome biogenesis SPOUT family RNA methylase Rps3
MDWKVVSLGDSNTLYLQATGNAVPEPGQTMAVLVVGGFLGGRVLRRRRTV